MVKAFVVEKRLNKDKNGEDLFVDAKLEESLQIHETEAMETDADIPKLA